MDYSYPLRAACNSFPERVAVRHLETALTFRELDGAVNRLAGGLLRHRCDRGPVASILENEPRAVILYMALARAGITSVPLNTRLHIDEKAFIVGNSGARTIVADKRFLGEAGELLERQGEVERIIVADDARRDSDHLGWEQVLEDGSEKDSDLVVDEEAAATIIYTSGTTGFPKGVVRSHRANLWNVVNSSLGLPRRRDEVELFNLPSFGIGFMQQAMPTLLAGGTLVLDGVFDPARAWELIETHKVTYTFLAPTMIAAMLDIPGHESVDTSSLRAIGVAYEFSPRLRGRALERFGDIFVNMYGLTEAQLCCASVGEFAGDPTSVGKPMGMTRVHIVDGDLRRVAPGEVGQIAYEGPSLMTRYHGLPELTAETIRDGWLLTGDLGYVDEAGNLHFAGRQKEIIKSGGFNIDPVEVENVILQLDQVRDAAVVGTRDERWGEAAVAFVVATEEIDASIVIDRCRARLTDFKVPKRVIFRPELPTNPTGKIERGRLRDELERGAA